MRNRESYESMDTDDISETGPARCKCYVYCPCLLIIVDLLDRVSFMTPPPPGSRVTYTYVSYTTPFSPHFKDWLTTESA